MDRPHSNMEVLLATLHKKEDDLILAAKLGNALLQENKQLREQNDSLRRDYSEKLEAVEQGRHQLQMKLSGSRSLFEFQVEDLEAEVGELNVKVQKLTEALADAQSAKVLTDRQLEETQEQLSIARTVQHRMSTELQALQQDSCRRGCQEEEVLSATREQVARLAMKNKSLEQEVKTLHNENVELKAAVATLHRHLAIDKQSGQFQSQQLVEARKELELVQSQSKELAAMVEELQEQLMLLPKSHPQPSLQSEFSTIGLDLILKEQITDDVTSVLQLLIPLTKGMGSFEGLKVTERDLPSLMEQLKETAQHIADAHDSENSLLQEQNSDIRRLLESKQEEAEQAIRDRDEAIAKKNLMEMELVKSKNDMMSLNNQLLEAIQRKLELSQELEAWQEDIQIILNQQLKSQQQTEQAPKKPTSNGFSFFRRQSMATSPSWAHPPPNSPMSSPELIPEKSHSPWKDWLRRGKVAQHGK